MVEPGFSLPGVSLLRPAQAPSTRRRSCRRHAPSVPTRTPRLPRRPPQRRRCRVAHVVRRLRPPPPLPGSSTHTCDGCGAPSVRSTASATAPWSRCRRLARGRPPPPSTSAASRRRTARRARRRTCGRRRAGRPTPRPTRARARTRTPRRSTARSRTRGAAGRAAGAARCTARRGSRRTCARTRRPRGPAGAPRARRRRARRTRWTGRGRGRAGRGGEAVACALCPRCSRRRPTRCSRRLAWAAPAPRRTPRRGGRRTGAPSTALASARRRGPAPAAGARTRSARRRVWLASTRSTARGTIPKSHTSSPSPPHSASASRITSNITGRYEVRSRSLILRIATLPIARVPLHSHPSRSRGALRASRTCAPRARRRP